MIRKPSFALSQDMRTLLPLCLALFAGACISDASELSAEDGIALETDGLEAMEEDATGSLESLDADPRGDTRCEKCGPGDLPNGAKPTPLPGDGKFPGDAADPTAGCDAEAGVCEIRITRGDRKFLRAQRACYRWCYQTCGGADNTSECSFGFNDSGDAFLCEVQCGGGTGGGPGGGTLPEPPETCGPGEPC